MTGSHYHFIGIGGIGVGALASLMLSQGYRVSGSDVRENEMTRSLREQGARLFIGHDAAHLGEARVVVYSSAVREDNPELAAARQRGLPVLRRAELLADLMKDQTGITVAGAHGKTTTTSMIANLLQKAGMKPTVALGGIPKGGSYQAHLGEGRYFVAEVDESDGSFLFFHPKISIITNIDCEHLDYYGDWPHILKAFGTYIGQTHPDGKIVICGEDQNLKALATASQKPFMTYGFSPDNDVFAENIRLKGCTTSFDYHFQDGSGGTLQLLIPGRHNVLNALACLCVARCLGLDRTLSEDSFRSFEGVDRRFQIKGRRNDVTVIDDYGHHPTEISATLQAALALPKKRLITVFQPHRYSRTKFLMDEFVKSLSACEYLIITDIYAASEPPLDGVSARELCRRFVPREGQRVLYLKKEDIVRHLLEHACAGDVILTLGAGDIYRVGEKFLRSFGAKRPGLRSDDQAGVLPGPVSDAGKIGVLMGGVSSEKEISLKTGKAITAALQKAGCRAVGLELASHDSGEVLSLLDRSGIDLVFIAMHGAFGEDGTLQEVLENSKIPFTGSDARASRLAMDKMAAQGLLRRNGILVPEHMFIFRDGGVTPEAVAGKFGDFPVVVKPTREGSSIGIGIVRRPEEIRPALEAAFRYGPDVIVERFIQGREITAGILGEVALPLVEIRPRAGFFDFQAKYEKGMTEYIVPAPIPEEAAAAIRETAVRAFRLLGCRDFARADFVLVPSGKAYFLEMNTIPGFTATSLLPMAAKEAGVTFEELCLRIVRYAADRRVDHCRPSR